MTYHPRRSFWITLRLDPTRTQDIRLEARSHWAAWWLAGVLHPGVEIIGVREIGSSPRPLPPPSATTARGHATVATSAGEPEGPADTPTAFPTMNNPTSREVGRVVAIGLTVIGLLLLALAQWVWSHRREILDTIARAILRTYAAGRWCRAQLEVARALLVATSDRAAALVDAQPVPALAPISANLQALRELLERWVSRLYRQLAV